MPSPTHKYKIVSVFFQNVAIELQTAVMSETHLERFSEGYSPGSFFSDAHTTTDRHTPYRRYDSAMRRQSPQISSWARRDQFRQVGRYRTFHKRKVWYRATAASKAEYRTFHKRKVWYPWKACSAVAAT
jgi:hypothetical protein